MYYHSIQIKRGMDKAKIESSDQGWQDKELNRLSLKNNLTDDGNYFWRHLKCMKILLREYAKR